MSVLEVLVVPGCFLVAGAIGSRLGTPRRVAAGLAAVGVCHVLALLGAEQALRSAEGAAPWVHLASQLLFLGGFVALVWLAACYPSASPPARLVGAAVALAVVGPLAAALSGPTPALADQDRPLGPVVDLLPASLAGVAVAPLLFLPCLAVVVFAVRYRRAGPDDRRAMRWPIAGLAVIASLVLAGTLLGTENQSLVSALFLLAAPIFPLSLAFGPVVRQLDDVVGKLAEARSREAARPRPGALPGVLSRLSPRELAVLERMAEGMANPVIARSLHLSLSSVEKHATSVFRKLEVPEGADVHRRVAAVVAYRDALEGARDQRGPLGPG